MDRGIYEHLVTTALQSELDRSSLLHDVAEVEKADRPHVLARHVSELVRRSLASITNPEDQVAAANLILTSVNETAGLVLTPPQQLTRVFGDPVPGVRDRTKLRPATPLSEVALLTNSGNGEPSIGHELPAEIASADRVDLVCAFIRWSGVRLLERELKDLAAAGKPLRIITTTYLGSTERAALDRMIDQFGAEVSVQYDALRTRLHAKAWMFHRNSGLDTAYIGSSNLSNAALIDGVEWNVRLSRVATPSLLERFQSTFETYWNDDPAFERYDPTKHRDRLDDALAAAAGHGPNDRATVSISNLDVRPYPYQETMLEELWAERAVHNRHKNLVVAATGTGKTVVAALDYRHLTAGLGRSPRLLFVAHRKEIIHQALRTFREVLSDANFGEILVDGARPERWDHVFGSVQSLSTDQISEIPAEHFDVVIIDEFHHAEAPTYQRLLRHLTPGELVGLTATPERADGADVRTYFGGRIATELRLWDALGAEILCPFHYFGIADGTDLSTVEWRRGAYDTHQLEALYTGDDARVRMVLRATTDKIANVHDMRALGFCVTVTHAHFMADKFNEAGIPAAVVHGKTPSESRARTLDDLRQRRINVIFSVDVFNEGLDIPDVDTILMLRPTESATIFLQQLGRGLRSRPHKPVLTVLDFVGHQRHEFRWDRRLRAMTGISRGKLSQAVDSRFPYLPSGCRIVLDEQTQQTVVSNLKRQLSMRWSDMASELRDVGDVTLREYLTESGLAIADVFKTGKNRGSWTKLRRDAGIEVDISTPLETNLLKRIKAFGHVDDYLRATAYRDLVSPKGPGFAELSDQEKLLAAMLHFSLWPDGGGMRSIADGLTTVRATTSVARDIREVIDVAFDDARTESHGLPGRLAHLPLQVHARYSREEALAGLGVASFDFKPSTFVAGVKWIPELNVDALFVNIQKTESSFSPTTMYRDYPISRDLFHWESQNATSTSTQTGARYVSGTSTILLFVRNTKTTDIGSSPYTFLGPAKLMSYEGDRPIAITWKLEHEMPADFFNEATVAAG
ncbi:DUF3427 domain-containing protein [Gordonia zhaorongruii]|uniref:DUF3427 domain-containing protein n=1 Tax=Gordonia zhaorongruii TaxID=2597659 RepID=UPI00117F4CAD|nr:DEAD/DEAH box helicase [Gordonia zhaorongruii]